jgi:hypothetical protein
VPDLSSSLLLATVSEATVSHGLGLLIRCDLQDARPGLEKGRKLREFGSSPGTRSTRSEISLESEQRIFFQK